MFVFSQSPSGIIISSSEFVDNEYILSISNPVEEGTYSCHLMNSDPTARCVQTNASLQFSAEVDVEAKDVLLAIYNASCGHEMEDVASSIAEHISRGKWLSRGVLDYCRWSSTCKCIHTLINLSLRQYSAPITFMLSRHNPKRVSSRLLHNRVS